MIFILIGALIIWSLFSLKAALLYLVVSLVVKILAFFFVMVPIFREMSSGDKEDFNIRCFHNLFLVKMPWSYDIVITALAIGLHYLT